MSGSSRGYYENFLNYRRKECSNFLWISRELKPQIAFKQGAVRPLPSSHKEAVLQDPRIQELLDELSQKQNIAKLDLEVQVKEILDEIGYNKKLQVIRWLGLVLTKICLSISTGIFANVDNIMKLREAMGTCPVVFVPSHRSYADFILMSCLCFTYDIEIPAIAAGMDFHGMWGMGSMLRDTGAFFMRRSYNDDSLYWTTFKQYVYQLVTKGDLPIEFFIEGTRSRSNKSLAPKYGLIAMILKAFFLAQVPDILFVPINISYDRILEESLFAFELLGVPKPKESTSGFFKSLKIVKEQFGNIYFHFDKPISAKEFFGDVLVRSVHGLGPIHQQEITEKEKALIPSLSYEIVYRQQKSSVITIFNLMCLVLNNNLSNRRELLSISELTEEMRWLKDKIETFEAFVPTENLEESIEHSFVVHGNLIELINQRVCLIQNNVTLDNIHPSKFKAHSLSEETMTYSVPYVMLQLYVNPTLHYLVDAAFLVFILNKHSTLSKDELFNHYHFLKSLFSLEFVTYAAREKMEFEAVLKQANALNLVEISESYIQIGTNKKLQEVLCSNFMPFILSYLIVCNTLQDLPLFCDEKTILVNIQKVLEKCINCEKGFVHPYCLNLDTLNNCLNILSSMKILVKSRSNNKNIYEINKEKLLVINNKLGTYSPSWCLNRNSSAYLLFQNKL